MRSFLFARFPYRFAISIAASGFLILSILGVLASSHVDDWHAATARYENWKSSGKQAKCESLFASVSAELNFTATIQCPEDFGLRQNRECSVAKQKTLAKLTDAVNRSDCPAMIVDARLTRGSNGWYELQSFAPNSPGSLLEYTLEREGLSPPAVPASIAAVALIVLVLSDIGRRLLLERHVGFKRLTLTLAIFAATTGCVWWYWVHRGEHIGQSLAFGIAAFAAAGLLLVYGWAIFLWISDGFGRNHASETTLFNPELRSEQLMPPMETQHSSRIERPDMPVAQAHEQSSACRRSGAAMFGLLRVIRGICGFVFALQVLQIITAVAWLAKPEAASIDMGKFFALLLIKGIILAVTGFLFFWLRGQINRLYARKHGMPHPALAEKKWAL